MSASPTRPYNARLQSSHHNHQRNRIVLRLLAEGSVVVVVMAFGCWGMANLGSQTLASESDSLAAMAGPIYVAGCPVAGTLERSSARGSIGKGGACSEGSRSHPFSSRQPGVVLGEHGRGAKRQGEEKPSPPTSEN